MGKTEKRIIFDSSGNPTELRYYDDEKLVARLGVILDKDSNFIGLEDLDPLAVMPSSWKSWFLKRKEKPSPIIIQTIDFIGLINWINTIKTIKTINTIDAITNIVNVDSLDLIDAITSITNIANLQSVDLIDLITRISLIDTITSIGTIKEITTLGSITNPIDIQPKSASSTESSDTTVLNATETSILTVSGSGHLVEAQLRFITAVAPTTQKYRLRLVIDGVNFPVVDNDTLTQSVSATSGRCTIGVFYQTAAITVMKVWLPIEFKVSLELKAYQGSGASVTTKGFLTINQI